MPMIVVHFESDSPHTTSESEEIPVISSILVVFFMNIFRIEGQNARPLDRRVDLLFFSADRIFSDADKNGDLTFQ